MSKFRITIHPSANQKRLAVVMGMLLLLSIWLWQPNVIPHQLIIQCLLCIVVVGYLFIQYRPQSHCQNVSLTEDGLWQNLSQEGAQPWRINNASRFNAWWLWLTLDQIGHNKRQYLLVFKDSLEDTHWRHLCRIVNQTRYQSQ